jgi:hypothetical protein
MTNYSKNENVNVSVGFSFNSHVEEMEFLT